MVAASRPPASDLHRVRTDPGSERRHLMPQSRARRRWMRLLEAVALVCALTAVGLPEAQAQQQKPNILVIMGDDIGWFNISAYNHGMMGYKTPNIDRIAKDGAMFTDWYSQQSCTAGRAA